MIIRGHGRVLIGERVVDAGANDLVRIPPLTWHQFRAADDSPLVFLCLVDCERDRPERPDAEALATLAALPEVAGFIRV